MHDLRIFRVEFENAIAIFNICDLELSCCKVCAKTKMVGKNFMKKTKMSKFWTENVLSGYFGLEFENNIVIFEINIPNLSNCKIS